MRIIADPQHRPAGLLPVATMVMAPVPVPLELRSIDHENCTAGAAEARGAGWMDQGMANDGCGHTSDSIRHAMAAARVAADRWPWRVGDEGLVPRLDASDEVESACSRRRGGGGEGNGHSDGEQRRHGWSAWRAARPAGDAARTASEPDITIRTVPVAMECSALSTIIRSVSPGSWPHQKESSCR